MRTLEIGRLLRAAGSLGGTAVSGLAVMAGGFAADLVSHASAAGSERVPGFTLPEHAAHAAVLVGMLISLAGLVVQGRRNARRAIPATHQ